MSISYLAWVARLWSHRRIRAYRYAHSHPVTHWALWNCIHGGEGNDATGTYTGPLQMTYPWDGFYVHWYYVPIATVYRYAEIGYKRSGYSHAWLAGQWPHTSPPCLAYA